MLRYGKNLIKGARAMSKTDLLMAYQSAIDLKIYEGELVWSRYGVMLTIHTIIVSVLGVLLKNDKGLDLNLFWLLIPIGFIGMYFCFSWRKVTARGFATNKYWLYSARELEYLIKNPSIKMTQRGEDFSKDQVVSFQFGPKHEDRLYFERPQQARGLTTEEYAYRIIYVFCLIYECFLFIGLWSMVVPYVK